MTSTRSGQSSTVFIVSAWLCTSVRRVYRLSAFDQKPATGTPRQQYTARMTAAAPLTASCASRSRAPLASRQSIASIHA